MTDIRRARNDLELVKSGHLAHDVWIARHAAGLIDTLEATQERLKSTVQSVGIFTELAVKATRTIDQVRRLLAAFRRVTGAKQGKRVGHTPFRWVAAQNLATELELEIAKFLDASAATPAEQRRPMTDAERAQKLADVMNQIEAQGLKGPEVERFRKSVAKVRKYLLGDQAVENIDPPDGGREN